MSGELLCRAQKHPRKPLEETGALREAEQESSQTDLARAKSRHGRL